MGSPIRPCLQRPVVSPTVPSYVKKARVVPLFARRHGLFAFRFQSGRRVSLGSVCLDCPPASSPGSDRRHDGSSLSARLAGGLSGVCRHDVLGGDRHAPLWQSPPPRQHRADACPGGIPGPVRRPVCLGIYPAGTTMACRSLDRGPLLVGLPGVRAHPRVQRIALGPVGLLPISMAAAHPDRQYHRRLRRILSHRAGQRLVVFAVPLDVDRKPATRSFGPGFRSPRPWRPSSGSGSMG